MTSKELAKEIRSIITYLCEVSGKQDKYALECCDVIEKNLDVLEILKPHLINAGIGKFDKVEDNEILHLKLTLSGKEYNTIKGWLENEK